MLEDGGGGNRNLVSDGETDTNGGQLFDLPLPESGSEGQTGSAEGGQRSGVAFDRFPRLVPSSKAAEALGFVSQWTLEALGRAEEVPHWRLGKDFLFDVEELRPFFFSQLLKRVTPGQPLSLVPAPPPAGEVGPVPAPKPAAVPAALGDFMHLLSVVEQSTPGVYFLVRDNAVAYVGKSVNVPGRISAHRSSGMKFDHALYLRVEEVYLASVEGAFIRVLQPPENKAGATTPSEADFEVIRRFSRPA